MEVPDNDSPRVSIVIANWNGEGFLRRCLSSAMVSLRAASLPGEVIVVDDASTDASCEIIRAEFPQARLIENQRNLGFIATVNRGVKAARGAFVVLLNNDIVVQADFIKTILSPLSDAKGEKTFGVSARTVSWTDNKPNHVLMSARFRRGKIVLDWSDPEEPQPTLFIQGGACAVRRQLFLRLGGFQPIFHPGYWEDYDLSYLAARCGYKCVYEPRSLAFHLGKASMLRSLGHDALESVKRRNEFIFTWLNITDAPMLLEHFFFLPLNLFGEMWRNLSFTSTKALLQAAACLPGILRIRIQRRRFHRLPDSKILPR